MENALIDSLQFSILSDDLAPLDGFWNVVPNEWQKVSNLVFVLMACSIVAVTIGAFYVFDRRQKEYGSVFLKLGKTIAVFASIVQYLTMWKTPGQLITEYQPPTLSATDELFDTGRDAPIGEFVRAMPRI